MDPSPLTCATMCAVAWAAHALIPGLPWAAAFVLGAIVSPTDPLAAAAIMRRLDAPRRLVSTIEGEGLFGAAQVDLRCIETVHGEGAVHLRYEVR